MSRRHRVQALLRARLPRREDDRGSLAMAMMAVLVGATLGALILPMVIAQDRSTRFDTTRVHALHAAQSGIDVMIGQIGASSTTDADGNVSGVPGRLPCYTDKAALTGKANGAGAADAVTAGTYRVSVAYYATDPALGGKAMICAAAPYGTYDPDTGTATPRYAVIVSTGKDGGVDGGSRGRTLTSTYVFSTDQPVIAGGLIPVYTPPQSTVRWCMEAGDPVAGADPAVVLATCSESTPLKAQQRFVYRSDLSIQLASSVTKDAPSGLCLDTSTLPHRNDLPIVLKTCGVADPARCGAITTCSPTQQQWTLTELRHLVGSGADRNTDNHCINVSAQAAGTPLLLETPCAGGIDDTSGTWLPSPEAGVGMAGATYNQLVNYGQLARCLDVTANDPNYAYLIVYPCKQSPDPTRIGWNQKFTASPAPAAMPTAVLLRTTVDGGGTYCLASPLTNGGYVRVTGPCPADPSLSTPYRWMVYLTKDSNKSALPYAQRYTIVDVNGRCLGVGPSSDKLDNQYSKATVSTCDGSSGQKWNASPGVGGSRLTNTRESPAP